MDKAIVGTGIAKIVQASLSSRFLRIKIIQKPRPLRMEDVQLDHFEVGRTYDVSWRLGGYLLIQGWADVDVSEDADAKRPPAARRRQTNRRHAQAANRARKRKPKPK